MKLHLIKTNDNILYQVIHQEPETKSLDVEKMKTKHQCSHVFRKDGLHWFVRIIEEIQIIDDNLENQQENSILPS
jgi:hypothetical protein